jgi:hypothetical protein
MTMPNWFLHVIVDAPDHYEFAFDTPWSPPVPVWEKMGEMFPTLEVSLSGLEPINDDGLEGTIQHGKLELRNVPLIWETVDPKTGETVSGSQEEIFALSNDRGGLMVSSRVADEEEERT